MQYEDKLLTLATDAGELMISSGAETGRVEDTMKRILSANYGTSPQAFVVPSGVFACVYGSQKTGTRFKSISQRAIDLQKISRINTLSRKFVAGYIDIDEALAELEEIKKIKAYPFSVNVLSTGIACGFFTAIIGYDVWECITSFFTGVLLGSLMIFLSEKTRISALLRTIIGAAFSTAFILVIYQLGLVNHYNNAIIGAIMPLVPGVATTSALRDLAEGNFVSGTSRLVEALLLATSIAGGVGLSLNIYAVMGGI